MTNISYVTFMKHAQKITKGKAVKTRPILGGVIHRPDYVAVTDSHRMYFATGLYEGEEKNVNPITGSEIDHGTYPDVLRLLPEEGNAKQAIKLSVTELHEIVRAIEIISRLNKTDILTITVANGYFAIGTSDKASASVNYEVGDVKSENVETMLASIQYVKEALHLFKDAKVDEVVFEFHGEHRPFTFKSGNTTALLLPERKH